MKNKKISIWHLLWIIPLVILITILSWANFRFFLGNFRSRLFELLEEPNDVIIKGLVRDFSLDQIEQWETRVRLIDAKLIQNETIDGRFDLKLTYEIIESKVEDSFIFPFYDKITN